MVVFANKECCVISFIPIVLPFFIFIITRNLLQVLSRSSFTQLPVHNCLFENHSDISDKMLSQKSGNSVVEIWKLNTNMLTVLLFERTQLHEHMFCNVYAMISFNLNNVYLPNTLYINEIRKNIVIATRTVTNVIQRPHLKSAVSEFYTTIHITF